MKNTSISIQEVEGGYILSYTQHTHGPITKVFVSLGKLMKEVKTLLDTSDETAKTQTAE